MATSKKNTDKVTRRLDRLLRDLPNRTITTEEELFEWLFEYLDASERQKPISAAHRRWVDEFKIAMSGRKNILAPGFTARWHPEKELLSGPLLQQVGEALLAYLMIACMVMDKYDDADKIPVQSIRLVAILLMLGANYELVGGLKYDGNEWCIRSSAQFEKSHKIWVFVELSQTPETKVALELLERYERKLDGD